MEAKKSNPAVNSAFKIVCLHSHATCIRCSRWKKFYTTLNMLVPIPSLIIFYFKIHWPNTPMICYRTAGPDLYTGIIVVFWMAASFRQSNHSTCEYSLTVYLTVYCRVRDWKFLQLLQEFCRGLWLQRGNKWLCVFCEFTGVPIFKILCEVFTLGQFGLADIMDIDQPWVDHLHHDISTTCCNSA